MDNMAFEEMTMKTQKLTITLHDPVSRRNATREAKKVLARYRGPVFAVLAGTGLMVDIMAGTDFFDRKKVLLQRILLKDPFNCCKVSLGNREIKCLGVMI